MTEDLSKLMPEAWMQACPTGVLVVSENHIAAANSALERMTRIPARELLGASVRNTRDPKLRPLLTAEGLLHWPAVGAPARWFKCTSAQIEKAPGEMLELRFYQDVSDEIHAQQERDALALKVAQLDLTDALTGLANRRALGHALTAQVTRSRRYHNLLSLALVRIGNEQTPRPLADGVILRVSQFLRNRLRWADIIGRYSDDVFMLILPETDLKAANHLLSAICAQSVLPDISGQDAPLPLQCGLAQWRKGMDSARLVENAQAKLGAGNVRGVAQPG
jgi:GGDEF domain-containing protein